MSLTKITSETLKKELNEYKKNNKNSESFDSKYITRLEKEYNLRFIGAHVCKDNLNIQVYTKKDNSGNYTTATITIPDFRKSTTALRFAEAVCDLLHERAELKHSDKYKQMQEQAKKLKLKPQTTASENMIKENSVYSKDYTYQFKKQQANSPSLDELTLTMNAINSISDINNIRAQTGPIKKIINQYV